MFNDYCTEFTFVTTVFISESYDRQFDISHYLTLPLPYKRKCPSM